MQATTSTNGKWAGRFITAAIIQGLIATVVTVLVIDPFQYLPAPLNWTYYSPAMVIASGANGGMWLFVGYISYLVVGVVAAAVTAIFYFYIEGAMGKVYKGISNYLAWGHLLLMNVGVTGAMLLMISGGYNAGYASGDVSRGGLGTPGIVHPQILSPLVQPIGALILVAALGALLGGIGFIIRSRTK